MNGGIIRGLNEIHIQHEKITHTHERAYYSAKSNEMNGKLTSKNDRMAEWIGRENRPNTEGEMKWWSRHIGRTASITGPNGAVEMGDKR